MERNNSEIDILDLLRRIKELTETTTERNLSTAPSQERGLASPDFAAMQCYQGEPVRDPLETALCGGCVVRIVDDSIEPEHVKYLREMREELSNGFKPEAQADFNLLFADYIQVCDRAIYPRDLREPVPGVNKSRLNSQGKAILNLHTEMLWLYFSAHDIKGKKTDLEKWIKQRLLSAVYADKRLAEVPRALVQDLEIELLES